MTLAGKEFKNIYDAGAKMLGDIELESIAKIKQDKEQYSQDHKTSAEQSLSQIEDKSTLLQGELKQSINVSLNKLETTLVLENKQTQVFVSSLISELNILTEQMKGKIKALKQAHHENVDFAGTVASENYLTDTEEVSFELEQTLSRSIDNLSAQGKMIRADLDKNLTDKFSQVNSSMDEIIRSTLLLSEKDSQTIPVHTSTLLQALSVNSQNKFKVLEQSARDANQDVEAVGRSLLEAISAHASSIEKDINSNYDQITSAHFQSSDNRLSICADELSELHDSTTEQLVNLTEEYSADLMTKSNQVQESLRVRCSNVVNNVSKLFNQFKTHLDDRLSLSRGQKQGLEADKNKLLVAVQNEMVSIQKTFAKKLVTVLEQSKSELTKMTETTEKEIMQAVESFGGQMDISAESIQKQIEDEVSKFLSELSVAQSDAVNEIQSAVKGDTAFSANASDLKNNSHASVSDDLVPSESASIDNPNPTQFQDDSLVEDPNSTDNKSKRNRRRKDTKE